MPIRLSSSGLLVAVSEDDWREVTVLETHPRFSCHEVTAQAFSRQSFLERFPNQPPNFIIHSFFDGSRNFT